MATQINAKGHPNTGPSHPDF